MGLRLDTIVNSVILFIFRFLLKSYGFLKKVIIGYCIYYAYLIL